MSIKKDGISPMTMELISSLVGNQLKKSENKPKHSMNLSFADPHGVAPIPKEGGEGKPTLIKSVLNLLNGGREDTIERLAFETDPGQTNTYAALYRNKLRLLPDGILKRIAIQDSLVAAIVNARSAQAQSFGREQPNRHSTGFSIEPKEGILDGLSKEKKEELNDRMGKVARLLMTCGHTSNVTTDDQMTFSQYLGMSTRNAVTVGRLATEVIYALDPESNEMKFHSFRPIDAGTIYRAAPYKESAESVRREALHLLEQVKNKDFEPEKFKADSYTWIQVVEGHPVQAFTSNECLVHSFYPVSDIELDGYPLTPIDTAISDITTHINITTHNKLYFQAGRASRGMLIIQSDDVDERVVQQIKQQFNASINSVANAWRMPVFGVGKDDSITWNPIDTGSRDMEFQYLSDSNSRVILSAFQMSPEELPGYAHLCLHPDTKIWTQSGITSLGGLLGDKEEVSGFNVWTGKKWSEARIFKTGEKEIRRTSTSNGVTVSSSPEHRFRVVDEAGELAWREQKNLQLGDVVLVNRRPMTGYESNIPSYEGKKLTPDMMEVLGWLTGDGSILVSKRGKINHSKTLEFYYHHSKETAIRARHLRIMQEFGLEPRLTEKHISVAAIEKQKRLCGFNSVSEVRLGVSLYNTKFIGWLLEQGFNPSNESKAIPSFIHGLPVEYRGAFLKGFFSADGSRDNLNTPSITICDSETREDTKMLLLNMGIRTRACEGTTRTRISSNKEGLPYTKYYAKEPSRLIVKDKNEFYERVGFLQPHKQPNFTELKGSACRWDRVPRSVAVKLAEKILANDDLHSGQRESVRHILKDPPYSYQVKSKLQNIAEQYGTTLPDWTKEYFCESVVGLETSDEKTEMLDIEVFDDEHAFIANGLVVHNSRGTNNQALSESNNEYKIEAARDVGIRPLISNLEDFVNARLFPLIDKDLSKICVIRFLGLDAETPEKESTRLQQDAPVHMVYDEVLQTVEKKPLGMEWGGEFPLNPALQQVMDKYLTVGEILERFFGREGASKDPALQYRRDPFHFQQVQMAQQQQAQQQQIQMAQQQQAQGGQPPPDDGSGGGQPPQGGASEGSPDQGQAPPEDLSRSIDQVMDLLTKSEADLPPSRRRLLQHHRKTVEKLVDSFKLDTDELAKEVMDIAEGFLPKDKQ